MINWDKHLLKPLMSEKIFGERVNYRPKNGPAFDITGVFDRPYSKDYETLDGTSEINTTSPVLGIRLAEFVVAPRQGDRLYIYQDEAVFVVKDPQPDSHGGMKLVLNRVKEEA